MRITPKACAWMLILLGIPPAHGAQAQVFDLQSLMDNTLFAMRDRAARQDALERRRAEAAARELARRSDHQAAMLQEQALAVQALTRELQMLRDERRLIEQAEAFDAAIASRDWGLVRSFLADAVTVDLPGQAVSGAQTLAADLLVSNWARTPASATRTLPRSNPRVRIEADRAVLTSSGYASEWSGPSGARASQRTGEYEYRFARAPGGWKLDALSFRALALRFQPDVTSLKSD